MFRYAVAVLVVALFVVALPTTPTTAQDDMGNTIVEGLNNPRGIFYAEDGTLFIAEGGIGGDVIVDTPEGPQGFGMTSQLSRVTPDGEYMPLLTNFASVGGSGVSAVFVTDSAIWLTFSAGPANAPLLSPWPNTTAKPYALKAYGTC